MIYVLGSCNPVKRYQRAKSNLYNKCPNCIKHDTLETLKTIMISDTIISGADTTIIFRDSIVNKTITIFKELDCSIYKSERTKRLESRNNRKKYKISEKAETNRQKNLKKHETKQLRIENGSIWYLWFLAGFLFGLICLKFYMKNKG